MNEITLYKKAKNGSPQMWSIQVEDKIEFLGTPEIPVWTAKIIRKAGYVGKKITQTDKFVNKGCNIGKSNEKSPYELAVSQAEKMIKDHIEDNWHYSIDDINKPIEFIKPMLAEKLNLKKIKFPCYAQPKMNGVRCFSLRHLSDDTMWSRERHSYDAISEIKQAVGQYFEKYSPDGEIYNPDITFEEITSFVKKRQPGTETLKMWVYDLAIPDLKFWERYEIIENLFETYEDKGINDYFHLVPTYVVNSFEELDKLHDQFVLDGYEGLIIRDPDGVYEFNERPFSLMKYKKFFDAEFEIIGYTIEVWHDTLNNVFRNLVKWVCATEDGKVFDARPRGPFLKREEALKTADEQIGKMYTVRYQNLSAEEGKPIFPIGIGIRDYE